ncbi:nocardicin N-oxygenase [Streptomyces sp. Amel2xB2]|uniref:cytochrome P450 n=1 Tax=Streptomyces sp. Amel2xB2 TaxID=1305829 RepID=UPI000DC01A92|nr:cytochrome P450 [Streptomyces sp. Amel2xB2]RAJ58789.1 nocardicin N-oxygenase [Streptomyces sp. Amel2xB2]
MTRPHAPQAPAYPFRACPELHVEPEYARLRREEPITRVTLPYGGEAWLVTRYDDVRFVLSDSRFSRADSIRPGAPRFFEQPVADGLGYLDPPEHTAVRRLLNRAFTARRVQAFRPRVQQIAEALLESPECSTPPVDLATAYAQPLAGRVVCEFVGVPYEDSEKFAPFFDAVVSTTAFTPDQIQAAVVGVQRYFTDLVAAERRDPSDTFFGELVRQNGQEGTLDDETLGNLGFGVVIAGYETTSSQLCNFTYLLLRRPERLRALQAEPDQIPDAVEELLRYVPMLSYGGNPVRATQDVTVAGQLVRAGETVVPSNNAANRDEQVFAGPDELDLTRRPNAHLAFHHGPHFCLGSQLARAELQIGLRTLLERRPSLALDVPPEQVAWKQGSVLRAPAALPVRW